MTPRTTDSLEGVPMKEANGARSGGALERLVRGCATHPWRTTGLWLAIIVAVFAANATFGGKLVNNTTIPGSEAQAATDLLKERFPAVAGKRSVRRSVAAWACEPGKIGRAHV